MAMTTSSFTQSLDGELMCGVCLELFDTPVMLPCSHNFCKKCIIGMVDNQMFHSMLSIGPVNSFNCPVCQHKVSTRHTKIDDLPVNKALESIITLYRNDVPVNVFDGVWNRDQEVIPQSCAIGDHSTLAILICETCNQTRCKECKPCHSDSINSHLVPLNDVVVSLQAEIASILADIKKESIPLNERIQLLADTLSGIDTNAECVAKQLDHRMSAVMATVRQKQVELKRLLQNDITKLKQPTEDQLRKSKHIRTMLQELMKNLSDVRNMKDNSAKVTRMKNMKKQLNTLLYFDVAWNMQDSHMPEVSMPTWELDIKLAQETIENVGWQIEDTSAKIQTVTCATQTDSPPTPPPPSSPEHPETPSPTTERRTLAVRQAEKSPYTVVRVPQPSRTEETKRGQYDLVSFQTEHLDSMDSGYVPSEVKGAVLSPNVRGPERAVLSPNVRGPERAVLSPNVRGPERAVLSPNVRGPERAVLSPNVRGPEGAVSMPDVARLQGAAAPHSRVLQASSEHRLPVKDEAELSRRVSEISLHNHSSSGAESRHSFPPDGKTQTHHPDLRPITLLEDQGAEADKAALNQFIARRSNPATNQSFTVTQSSQSAMETGGDVTYTSDVSLIAGLGGSQTASRNGSRVESDSDSSSTPTSLTSCRQRMLGGELDTDSGSEVDSVNSYSAMTFSKKPVSANLNLGSPSNRRIIRAQRKTKK